MAAPLTVLVTGAAGGRQGSTGNHVLHLLRRRGASVRALVHRLDGRADALRSEGVDVVAGDLLDVAFVRRAMTGVERAYFAYPVQAGLLDATTTFAVAAREAGVTRVVNLSQLLNPGGVEPTPHQQRHWLAERIFDWADVGVVHLNATVFFENLRALAGAGLAATGALVLPWGPAETIFPMVSAQDVARVAVGVLTAADSPPNGTVIPLIGEAVRVGDIAKLIGERLGRAVPYREIADDQWAENLANAGINEIVIEHLVHLWRFIRTRPADDQRRYQVSDAIGRIGGAPPTTLRQFLSEQPADLGASALVASASQGTAAAAP